MAEAGVRRFLSLRALSGACRIIRLWTMRSSLLPTFSLRFIDDVSDLLIFL